MAEQTTRQQDQCDYCGELLPDDYPRHECPVCGCQACGECSCGLGTAHFDCEGA